MTKFITLYLVIGLVAALGTIQDIQRQCGEHASRADVYFSVILWPALMIVSLVDGEPGVKFECEVVRAEAKEAAQ